MKFVLQVLFGCLLSISSLAQQTVVRDANAQERKVEPFTSVVISGGMIAYLAQGTNTAVAVSASDAADLSNIQTVVRNGTLYVQFKRTNAVEWKSNRKLKAYITVTQLQNLQVQGGSIVHTVEDLKLAGPNIRVQGGSIVDLSLEGASCQLSLEGGSIATLKGSVTALNGDVEGGSILKAGDYKAANAELRAAGGSIVTVEVNQKLKLSAQGGSVVNIDGNPADRSVEKNGGSVISLIGYRG